jgi:hypothetical protein
MENKPIKISGRQRLLAYFRNGKIPSEEHYSDLINSMVHKDDDGFSKDDQNGLKIYADEKYNSLISFYKNINSIDPFFVIGKDKTDPDALKVQPIDGSADNADPTIDPDATSFFLHTNGKVGIGKKCEPQYKMEIDGFVGMGGRIGTYRSGSAPANGKWQPIVTGLRNAQAFEIVARVGKKGTGKCAIMHATALSIFGPKGGKIRRTNGHFGWFWNKMHLRWTGDSTNYTLEIKVGSNYGDDVEIFYTVSRLWDDSLFLSDDYYYSDKT